jgi:hypothetical protein
MLELPSQPDYGITDSEASSRGSPETISSRGSPETISSRSSPETIGPDSPESVEYNPPLKRQRPMPIPTIPIPQMPIPPMPIPDQLAPLLQPNNITNINNIQEGNFGDMVTQKTKYQFAARQNSTRPLGIKLYFFENRAENTFTKTFVYNKYDDSQSVLVKILSEVYYHKKFYDLQGTCKFKAPKLIQYGYVENGVNEDIDLSNSFMFYIKMERIDALQVSKLTGDNAQEKCKEYRSKLVEINKCLQDNYLYHNDLHADNVMINREGDIAVIIDFGEATDTLIKFDNFDKFCSKFEKKRAEPKPEPEAEPRVEGSTKRRRIDGGRKSKKQFKVIKRGATKRRPAKKMRRTIKKRRSYRRARK